MILRPSRNAPCRSGIDKLSRFLDSAAQMAPEGMYIFSCVTGRISTEETSKLPIRQRVPSVGNRLNFDITRFRNPRSRYIFRVLQFANFQCEDLQIGQPPTCLFGHPSLTMRDFGISSASAYIYSFRTLGGNTSAREDMQIGRYCDQFTRPFSAALGNITPRGTAILRYRVTL